ncbi:MAG: GNAT family N-acetyltransferase [Candidatus Bathyarchaeia archaeon]
MTPEDFEFAIRLTDTQGWNFIEEDFKFMTSLEPEGCFVLFDDSKRVGIVTSIGFDKLGWLGNLIVEEKYRRKGAGALLVKSVIEYLSSKNVNNVGLYAYVNTIPFYEKLGFKYDSDFVVLEGKAFTASVESSLRVAKEEDFQRIVDYDSYWFGASRKKLLDAILQSASNPCFLSVESERIVGYVMAKVYDGIAEIGPLMCLRERETVAIDLLKAILNKLAGSEVSLCLPKKESAIISFLMRSGFTERFSVARMFLKPFNAKDCFYLAESLERG